jgi:hypothetical protein
MSCLWQTFLIDPDTLSMLSHLRILYRTSKKKKKSQLLSIKLISEIETYIQPQLKPLISQVPMIHTCNPSYSRGKDQEDCSLKPFLGK